MKNEKVRSLALGGMFAAAILVMTLVFHVPVPATGGYVHLGDGFIFLTAAVLGPSAALAAAVGSALADLLSGYLVYIPATFIIKGAMGFLAGKMCPGAGFLKNLAAFLLSEAVMVLGYFVFEWMLYGAAAAAGAVIPNLMQGVGGIVFGVVLTEMVRRLPGKRTR